MSWTAQQNVVGIFVQWDLGPKQCVTVRPNQHGKVKYLSYPTGGIGNPALLAEVSAAAELVRRQGGMRGRFGHQGSHQRWQLCDRLAKHLNECGVSPHVQLTSTQRPEGGR